jgi:hypothetical protein
MNKKYLTVFAVIAIGLLTAFNLTLDNQGNRAFDLSLANAQQAYDLEEVVCTCGHAYGQCWKAYSCSAGPWCGCEPTGIMSDFCVYG